MAVAETLFEGDEQALLRIWQRAEARLHRILGSVTASSFQRARARVLLEQVEAAITDLLEDTQSWLDRTLPKAFESGWNWTGSGLLPQDYGVIFSTIPRLAVETVAASIAQDVRTALASVAPNISSVFTSSQQAILAETQLMEMVAQELIEGRGTAALARDLAAALRDGALRRLNKFPSVSGELKNQLRQTADGQYISILCKDGKVRRYSLRAYSETVARTSTRMAQTEGTLRSAQELNIDLVQISVHANPCLTMCAPVQGKVYSISGQSRDFPALTAEVRPPIHPRCRHVLLPAPEAFLRAKGVYDTLRDFSNDASASVADAYAYRDLLRSPQAALAEALA